MDGHDRYCRHYLGNAGALVLKKNLARLTSDQRCNDSIAICVTSSSANEIEATAATQSVHGCKEKQNNMVGDQRSDIALALLTDKVLTLECTEMQNRVRDFVQE